jgi:NAD(P)-dependent dehydrogenase (short-subunit alcohol dehydrogenase family)
VTCAAAGPTAGPSEQLAEEEWRRVIETDLTGVFLTCRAAGRQMIEQRYGRIVNMSSFHVVGTYPERAAYVAAKAGVVGLTQALAVEWGGRGVTVNAVAPGPIRTPRTSWFLAQDPANEAGMIGRTPTGRVGELDDVTAVIRFLCSPQARHVTGQTVVVDGGWTRNAWWGSHPWKGHQA